jgi:uncharacterized protein (DUF1786 family)
MAKDVPEGRKKDNRILAIDIGGGTQDILLYEEGTPVENSIQMVLPSPTRLIALKIRKATASGKNIFFAGNTMGGGPCIWAIQEHLQMGLRASATPLAALTFHDNLKRVQEWGIQISLRRPKGYVLIELHDLDLPLLRRILRGIGQNLPSRMAIAVQDHGFSPHVSNRRFRFRHWERFLSAGGELGDLLYREPPSYMSRMRAIQRDAPQARVMDTAAAAIWGMLCDPQVAEKQGEGFIALNLGNQHTFGALVQGDRIWGIFEHHTGLITREKLKSIVHRFRKRLLGHAEIYRDGGHGCAIDPSLPGAYRFRFLAITGPRRSLADGLGYMAAPYGNMMLAGCFGLIRAWEAAGR